MIRFCFVLLTLAAALPARGDDDRESRARAHYEVGLGMYHLGNYRDAVREFSAGYQLSPRPQFLINLGQAHRKLHELDRAAEMFQRYLATTPPNAPDRKQVHDLLDEVERARAAAPPGEPRAPSAAEPRAPSVEPAPDSAPTPATTTTPPATAALLAAPPPPRRSGLRRWWWTIPVGAVVVGAAVGLTLYFALPPSQVSCGSATIACVDLRH